MDLPSGENEGSNSKSVALVKRCGVPLGRFFTHRYPAALKISFLPSGEVTAWRITLANANVPNMVGQVSTCIANAGLNIEDLLNKSVGEFAYTIVDVNGEPSKELLEEISSIDGVLTLRNLGKPV